MIWVVIYIFIESLDLHIEKKGHNYCNILSISMNLLFIACVWKDVLATLLVVQKLIGIMHGAISTTNVHKKEVYICYGKFKV